MNLPFPEGYTPPENARPGEPFEVIAVVRPGENGGYTLVSLDGVEFGKEDDDEMDDFAKKVPMPWDQPELPLR